MKVPNWAFNLVGLLGLSIIAMVHMRKIKLSYWSIVKIFHYLVILPSFLYIAYKKDKLEKEAFSTMYITGVILVIYHSYKAYGRIYK